MQGRYRGLRRFAAVTAYVLGAAWGVHTVVGRDPAGDFVLPGGLVVACAVWCTADARARRRPLLWPARVGLLISGAAGVPVYLWWSRGTRGLGIAALAAAAWVGAVAVGLVAGALVAASAGHGAARLGRQRCAPAPPNPAVHRTRAATWVRIVASHLAARAGDLGVRRRSMRSSDE